jgi:enoyl-CoA hydratase/carnithine racemase
MAAEEREPLQLAPAPAPVLVTVRRGRIAVWRMNLPQKLNCLNVAMLAAMRAAFEAAATDAGVDAVVH